MSKNNEHNGYENNFMANENILLIVCFLLSERKKINFFNLYENIFLIRISCACALNCSFAPVMLKMGNSRVANGVIVESHFILKILVIQMKVFCVHRAYLSLRHAFDN